MSRVLLFSPQGVGSGNRTTILRIRDGLEGEHVSCFLLSPHDLASDKSVQHYEQEHNITLIVAVHAYKTGLYLLDTQTPIILILGGTDVNEYSKDQQKMTVMTQVVSKARHVVAFSDSVYESFRLCWPEYREENVSVISQAVQVHPSDFSLKTFLSAHSRGSVSNSGKRQSLPVGGIDLKLLEGQLAEGKARLFTVVGGIRRVKNPLFLMEKFSEWRSSNDKIDCWLVFVGFNQEDDFFSRFITTVKRSKGLLYIPGLSAEDTHALIRDSFALVNTSDSEGMAVAILEAMCLQIPVIVRGIPGNMAVVRNNMTGFIFNSPQEFFRTAEHLLVNKEEVNRVTQNALEYVTENHSVKTEIDRYLSIVKKYSA